MRGRVLPGGADWQIVRADGLGELDTRYTLETDDGKLIYVQNAGIRHASPEVTAQLMKGEPVDPSLVYFRTVPKFETSAPELAWLMRSIFVGTGERFPADVRHPVLEVRIDSAQHLDDFLAHGRSQFRALVSGHSLGRDGFADPQRHVPPVKLERMHRQNVAHADHRHGHDRNLRADGQERRAVLELP